MKTSSRNSLLVLALLLGAAGDLRAGVDPSAAIAVDPTDHGSGVIGTATLLCPSRIAFTIMQAGNYACELLPFLFSAREAEPGARVASWVPTHVDATTAGTDGAPDGAARGTDTGAARRVAPAEADPEEEPRGEGLLGR